MQDSLAAGVRKKNEAQNVFRTRSLVLRPRSSGNGRAAVRVCFTPSLLIAGPRCLHFAANKFEVDVTIDQGQRMIFRNLIFEPKVIKQRLRAGRVPPS